MAYSCPRCSQPVKRGQSGAAGFAGGIAGALIYAAFGSFQCKACGKIPMKEFPPEVRSKARMGSLALVGGALLLIVLVVLLQVYLRS
jgi:hypothetical protein